MSPYALGWLLIIAGAIFFIWLGRNIVAELRQLERLAEEMYAENGPRISVEICPLEVVAIREAQEESDLEEALRRWR